MTDKITIGADLGRQGAIAVLYGIRLLTVFDIPFVDVEGRKTPIVDGCLIYRKIAATALSEESYICATTHTIIENPTPKNGEGVTSAFTSGMWFGGVMAELKNMRADITVVRAQKWKKAMGCTADKATSMREAVARFPDKKDLFFGPRGGAKDGRAEAALIGLYGATHLWG